MAALVLSAYCIAWMLAWFFLTKWLHANRHEVLGKSLVNELIYGFMLAFVWPASMSLILLNDMQSAKNDSSEDDFNRD